MDGLGSPSYETMSYFKSNALLTIALLLAIAWLSGWMAGLLADAESVSWLRYGFSGFGFVLAVGTIYLWGHNLLKQQREAQRYFATLVRLDPPELARLGSGDEPLPIAPTNSWYELAQRFTDRYAAISEQLAQAEQARAALELRLRRGSVRQEQIEAVLSGMGDAVVAVNQRDELILANPAAERLFAFDEQSASGHPLTQVLRCEQLVELLLDTRRHKTHISRRGEVELIDPSGETHSFGVACQSLAADERDGGAGKPAGAFAVLRDTSDLKAAQRRYADFVASASHEMKSPLAGIKAYVELLADGEATDPETREEFLHVISSQADRLHRLIDNLLNLARIEAGVTNVNKGPISLNELLADTIDVVRPTAEAKQIGLTTDFSPMYLAVLADRDMMTQVAINLLSNAIKYTPDGGRVTLRSRLAEDDVQFEVEDTGVGLSPEDQARVFEKFYRVKKDRSMAGGTGLGLPLAKLIVEDVHGGRLTVRSTPGSGSVFAVSLPAAAQMA